MKTWVRFVRFNAVGALGIGVQLAALWILIDFAHVNYMLATPAAVGLAVLHNFVWHWWWTWRDRRAAGGLTRALARFALANGAVSLVGNLGVMAVLVSGADVGALAANAVSIAGCGLLNFWLGNEVVFRPVRPAIASTGHGSQIKPRALRPEFISRTV